jgi:hypothetical protein
MIQDRDDSRSKGSPPFEERSQGAGGVLPLTGDIAARFEAGADSSVGGGRAQHPFDSQGSWGPAADCQPLAASLWRIYCGPTEGVAIRTTLLALKDALPRLAVHRVTYREIGVFRQTPTHDELISTKRTAFEYEKEIRVVATEGTQDPTLSRGEFGYEAPFDVGATIHGISIHPAADQSFFDTVATAVDQYAPAIRNHVGWSHMKQKPPLLCS